MIHRLALWVIVPLGDLGPSTRQKRFSWRLMALPLAQITIKREKEKQLRHALWEMRDAIDRYKDLADRGGFQIKVDSNGYPPTLDDLVKGIDVSGKKMRFLRKVPLTR
jgi:general secretion pathway protein G